jgi:hypothetical protein
MRSVFVIIFIAHCFWLGNATAADRPLCEPGSTIVRPAVIDSVLLNPGMGFETFNRTNDAPADSEGWHPQTTLAYYRWYWAEIEPQEGAFRFDLIDDAIARAAEQGQRLAFRIMPAALETNAVPAWFLAKGAHGVDLGNTFVPDFNDSTYLAAAERIITAIGQRYDGNPSIDHVDVGMMGLWGEWHVTGVQGAPSITLSATWRVVDSYRRAFPRTTLLLPLNTLGGQKRAKGIGIGWRADCLGDCCGDMNPDDPSWNHHEQMYPVVVSNAGIAEQWRVAPVAFEVCWDIPTWHGRGYDVHAILQYALDYHVSILNAKSVAIPESWKPAIEAFQAKMGYRMVIDEVCHPGTVSSDGLFTFKVRWKNVGVAPPYHPYRIAYRLRDNDEAVVWQQTSDVDIRGWVPGARSVIESFTLPRGVSTGAYTLDIAMLDPTDDVPAIRFANAGRRPDGWYPVSSITVP